MSVLHLTLNWIGIGDGGEMSGSGVPLELETKVIKRFPKISQSRRRPLLRPKGRAGWLVAYDNSAGVPISCLLTVGSRPV